MHRFIIFFLITLVVSGPIYGTHVLVGVGADKERSIISGYLKDKKWQSFRLFNVDWDRRAF